MPTEHRNATWKYVRLAAIFLFLVQLSLALDYGHLSVHNILLLDDIDENVDYDPIFAAGRGWIASLIAVAGVLIGNGIGYLLSRYGYTRAKAQNKHATTQFFYLLWLMNVGNFLSYVPNRTFATHADMATVERGINASPWAVAIVLGIPFAIAIVHFLARILLDARRYLAPGSYAIQVALTILTTFTIFGFFGSAGISRYGTTSHWLATVCVYALLPLSTILYWPRTRSR
jgi:hypothetical protein